MSLFNYLFMNNFENTEGVLETTVIKPKKNMVREIFDWLLPIFFALLLSTLLKAFIFLPIEVQQESMENTLFEGEKLIVYRLGYFFNAPKRGDIVIFEYSRGTLPQVFAYLPIPNPKEINYIKRVIAIEGDTIKITAEGDVYVNGQLLEESYIKGRTYDPKLNEGAVVPKGSIFVMGDNREHSNDSRGFGFVDVKKVKGKAVFRLWPFDRIGKVL